MVRPASFGFNRETADSNAFQQKSSESISVEKALFEFDGFVETLSQKGIEVIVVEDTAQPEKPDAIFPNNWFSCHPYGKLILYPMMAPNRRAERRPEIIQEIQRSFDVKEIIDLSSHEDEGRFLEGTGSIVFDHLNRLAYACLSPRTDKELFRQVCALLGYQPVPFHALDQNGQAIYHTNVMMAIGSGYAVICLDSITNEKEKAQVIESLTDSSLTIVDISFEQMLSFCGNMLELSSSSGEKLLAMSRTAYNHLTPQQKQQLEAFVTLLPINVDTIETIGGGSVRCMMAEIFLPTY